MSGTSARTLRVLILAFDGVEALDFAGPFEVFTTASRVAQRLQPGSAAVFDVASVAQAGQGQPVQARAGLQLLANHTLADSPQADVLVVPGGVVDAAVASPGTLRWIADRPPARRWPRSAPAPSCSPPAAW
jgi:transcriptional regulator GlxA family with amidase domain